MERSTWPKNLSSSGKRAIMEHLHHPWRLHGQEPTKKRRDLSDAHSQAGNNTGQPLFAEDPVVKNLLRSFSNTQSESMSIESDEFLQFPSNACVWSKDSDEESINTPVRRKHWIEVSSHLDDEYSWRKYGDKEILGFKFPRSYFRCTYRNDQGCLATKQVQRMPEEPPAYEITYRGLHTCQEPHPSSPPTHPGRTKH